MKHKILIYSILIFSFFSCQMDESQNFEVEKVNLEIALSEQEVEILAEFRDSPISEIIPSTNQIVLKFKEGIQEAEREALSNYHGAISRKKCSCTNGSNLYELWTFDEEINIEPKTGAIRDEGGLEFVAQNFSFTNSLQYLDGEPNWIELIDSNLNQDYISKIVDVNQGITIAVLDAGLDTNFHNAFSAKFLHNSDPGVCGELSGWDFVDDDNNPFETFPYLHGTMVTYIIHSELSKSNINHNILPVRVADAYGNASFFNIICGLEYAIEKQANLINLSLGWYGNNTYADQIISNLISNTSSIIVASAGNKGSDNDLVPHFPSNYAHDNVVAVASADLVSDNVAFYSNFGNTSVDFFANGNNYAFPLNGNSNLYFMNHGTSFATPFVTARAAEFLTYNGWPSNDMALRLASENSANSATHYTKPVVYSVIIK